MPVVINFPVQAYGIYPVAHACGLFRIWRREGIESVLIPDGRRVMWAWVTSAGPDGALVNKTIQSLPRELSLPADGILRIHPLRELEGQRYDRIVHDGVTIANPVSGQVADVPPTEAPALQRIAVLGADACEIRIVIPRQEALR